jgi:hypothetical protein
MSAKHDVQINIATQSPEKGLGLAGASAALAADGSGFDGTNKRGDGVLIAVAIDTVS